MQRIVHLKKKILSEPSVTCNISDYRTLWWRRSVFQILYDKQRNPHFLCLRDGFLDSIFHAQTSGHPVSLKLGKHQIRVSLFLQLTGGAKPPLHPEFQPGLYNWEPCMLPLHHRLPFGLIRITELFVRVWTWTTARSVWQPSQVAH